MATLKASPQGLARIKQARSAKGWAVSDFRWVEAASESLGTSWAQAGVLAAGISEGTWKRFLAGKSPINAESFKAYCRVLGLDWQEIIEQDGSSNSLTSDLPQTAFSALSSTIPTLVQDWSDAPDVSIFYGRQAELNTVRQWVVQQNCRFITLLGMGGIGKTALSVRLAREIVDQQNSNWEAIAQDRIPFSSIIWRSLRNAPPIEDLLADLIQVLSNQQETNLPTQLEAKVTRLLHYLRSSRCVLVLDNAESILQAGDRTGRYRPGYEGYGQLLRCVAESPHQSCLILTSREKPLGLAKFEGESLPVRSLQLSGLPKGDGRELFHLKGRFTATEAEWQSLIERYAGNPLALKIVASSIHDYFDGDISYFLETTQQSAFLFDDIRDLLEQQFQRLTELERAIMYWLAIDREPVMSQELQVDFVTPIPPREFLESLNSLQRRSLIEKSGTSFTQQPVVMEYVTAQLIEQVCKEIEESEAALFASHALIKAQAKDYIRETQTGLILQPIVEQLTTNLGSTPEIARYLDQLLSSLRGRPPKETGYAAGNTLNLLHQAAVDLSGFDFSQLTVWQAYLQGVALHEVDFTASDLSRCVFTETLGNILAAAFSPDGQLLATCDTDCNVRVWEVRSGKLLLICQGHANWVRSLMFSPDGKTLASCGADCTVKLWNVQDGVCIKTFLGHEHEVFAVAFSPDGEVLASASGDRTIKLWHIQDGHCLSSLSGHTDWVRSVSFSVDGQLLASSGADHSIKLWDIETGECLRTLSDHVGWVRSIAFSPDGEVLASGSSDRTIKLWDYRTGNCVRTYTGHQNSVYSIAFSPDGKLLVSGSGDRTVRFWDRYTDTCIKTLHGQTNEVCCVAFSSDQQTIACVSLDQTMRLWNYQSGHCLKSWYGNTDWALPVTFSPVAFPDQGGGLLASGSNDKTVKLWDWQTGNCIRSLSGHTDFIYGLAFNSTGDILASASTDSTIRLWKVATGQCFQILQGHTDWVYTVAFHPEQPILVSGSADCTVRVWDSQTGRCLKTLTGHTDKIQGIAFSPDGQILATGCADQTVRLWDYQTGDCLQVLQGHRNRVYAVAFSPKSHLLASCSTDHTVKLWNYQSGECLETFTGHTNWVFAVAFNSEGNIFASASHDQTARVWDVETGECICVLTGHAHLVSSVAFSPDGQAIASGSQDQTVRVWDAATGQCSRTLIAKRLYEGMKLTDVKGLTPATIATLQTLGAVVSS